MRSCYSYEDKMCPVDGCNKKMRDIGYCGKHAQRFRRYGDVNYITPEKLRVTNNRDAQLKNKKAKKSSYRKFFGRHQHRVVAEEKIGRKLLDGEIVHHIDGDRHNNHPDNLQVMTQSDHIKLHHEEMIDKRWGSQL